MEDATGSDNAIKPPDFNTEQTLDQILTAYSQAFYERNPVPEGTSPADKQKHAEAAIRSFVDLLRNLGERCAAVATHEERLAEIYVATSGSNVVTRASVVTKEGIVFLPRPAARADAGAAYQQIRRLVWEEVDPAKLGYIEIEKLITCGTTVLTHTAAPSFYPGCRLIHIFTTEHTDGAMVWAGDAFAIEKPDGTLLFFDWSNGPIYELNREGLLRISAGAETYVRFFFHLVRGRYGRFLILETEEDVAELVIWNDPPAPVDEAEIRRILEKKAIVAQLCRPIALRKIDANGRLVYNTTMLFQHDLVEVDVTLDGNGLFDMGQPNWLHDGADLPVLWVG